MFRELLSLIAISSFNSVASSGVSDMLSILDKTSCEYLLPPKSALIALDEDEHLTNFVNKIVNCNCQPELPYALCELVTCLGFNLTDLAPQFVSCDQLKNTPLSPDEVIAEKLVLDLIAEIKECNCPHKYVYGLCLVSKALGLKNINWESKKKHFIVPDDLECKFRSDQGKYIDSKK